MISRHVVVRRCMFYEYGITRAITSACRRQVTMVHAVAVPEDSAADNPWSRTGADGDPKHVQRGGPHTVADGTHPAEKLTLVEVQ